MRPLNELPLATVFRSDSHHPELLNRFDVSTAFLRSTLDPRPPAHLRPAPEQDAIDDLVRLAAASRRRAARALRAAQTDRTAEMAAKVCGLVRRSQRHRREAVAAMRREWQERVGYIHKTAEMENG